MCGIAGLYNRITERPVARRTVDEMCELLAHRGPDDSGIFVEGALGLGHRRLSILDLSERGHQPMFYAGRRFVVVYNGEIFNYIELRQDLERQGCAFHTDTDTEVLLALYERTNERCLNKLNGMFAFAIWDSHDRSLFIARDRLGIKPLYYAETRDGFVFASEAKAIFRCPGMPCEPDPQSLGVYLSIGYVPGESTAFKNVKKLLPGHYLRVSSSRIERRKYWDVRYEPDTHRSAEDTASQLHRLLLDATRIHVRSDVPVGVFLSGGLDSSTTVALLSEAGIRNIKTFSVAYREGSDYDETTFAHRVSKRFDTEHKVLYLDASQFVGFISDYVWHMDEPVTEAAGISLYFISKLLRNEVTVALSGEGSDELFAGYDIYRYMLILEGYRRHVPRALREQTVEPILRLISPRLFRWARMARLPLEERYLGVSLPDRSAISPLLSCDFAEVAATDLGALALSPWYSRTGRLDVLSRLLYSDLKSWLVDDLLVKADKMTMASSVELRVPFLDHRVVEFAATIPSSMKLRGRRGKWVLREAMKTRLPPEILTRRKMGFPTPLAMMFRRDLSGYLTDVLASKSFAARGYFDQPAVLGVLREHLEGARDHHHLLWQMVVLEEWHRRFPDAHGCAKAH